MGKGYLIDLLYSRDARLWSEGMHGLRQNTHISGDTEAAAVFVCNAIEYAWLFRDC